MGSNLNGGLEKEETEDGHAPWSVFDNPSGGGAADLW